MADDFTRERLEWLEQVAVDPALSSPTAPRLAVLIATRYLNRKTKTAFPSRDTLAADLGVSVPAIGRAIDALESRGHMSVERARGRGYSNSYRILKKENADVSFSGEKTERQRSVSEEEKRTSVNVKGNAGVHKRERSRSEKGTPAFPEPYEEPYEEPIDGNPSRACAREEDAKPYSEGTVDTYHEALFDVFWAAYPRPVNRVATLKAWMNAIDAGEDPRVLVVAAKAYADQRLGEDPTRTKHSANWLLEERWTDPALVHNPQHGGHWSDILIEEAEEEVPAWAT